MDFPTSRGIYSFSIEGSITTKHMKQVTRVTVPDAIESVRKRFDSIEYDPYNTPPTHFRGRNDFLYIECPICHATGYADFQYAEEHITSHEDSTTN